MLYATLWHPANIKLTSMKRTFLKPKRQGLTALSDSPRNEVLFFPTAHFLFFNFLPTAQNTLSFFCSPSNPAPKKMKECFLQRFTFLRRKFILIAYFISKPEYL